jgi:hypothetical protein
MPEKVLQLAPGSVPLQARYVAARRARQAPATEIIAGFVNQPAGGYRAPER